MATDEGDVTIGPGKLLGLFFMLVALCGVFFAIGYSLGKTSAREQALNDKSSLSGSLSSSETGDPGAPKPSAAVSSKSDTAPAAQADPQAAKPDLTFYNEVKKDDSKLAGTDGASSAAKPAEKKLVPVNTTLAATGPNAPAVSTVNPPRAPAPEVKPAAAPATNGAFVVQIAAVTREEDAAALAGALRKKNYSVFVVNNPAVHDKFYHVQVGPFATMQDAEAMKQKLTGEGYNPIVKRS